MTVAITLGLIVFFAAPVCVPIAWVQLAERAERRRASTRARRSRYAVVVRTRRPARAQS